MSNKLYPKLVYFQYTFLLCYQAKCVYFFRFYSLPNIDNSSLPIHDSHVPTSFYYYSCSDHEISFHFPFSLLFVLIVVFLFFHAQTMELTLYFLTLCNQPSPNYNSFAFHSLLLGIKNRDRKKPKKLRKQNIALNVSHVLIKSNLFCTVGWQRLFLCVRRSRIWEKGEKS